MIVVPYLALAARSVLYNRRPATANVATFDPIRSQSQIPVANLRQSGARTRGYGT